MKTICSNELGCKYKPVSPWPVYPNDAVLEPSDNKPMLKMKTETALKYAYHICCKTAHLAGNVIASGDCDDKDRQIYKEAIMFKWWYEKRAAKR
jgi:hypothetical protein